jgi:hypothetical protein
MTTATHRPRCPWLRASFATVVLALASCGPPSAGSDAVEDDGGEEGDAVSPPACEVIPTPEEVGVDPCLDQMCFRPHLSLGGRPEGFLVAYSKNLAWWATDVFARIIDPAGTPVGAELAVSGLVDPPRSRPMMASSEFPFVGPFGNGWLVTWEDRMTTYVFIAGAALDLAGTSTWDGSEWTRTDGSLFRWVGVEPIAPVEPASPENVGQSGRFAEAEGGAMLSWIALGSAHRAGQAVSVGWLDSSRGRRTGTDLDITSDAARSANSPTIAHSGSTYLVAWEDRRDVNLDDDEELETDVGVWARVLSNDLGFVTDGEIPVALARYESSRPAVVWGGETYILAWQDYREGNFEILVVRVREDGSIVEEEGAPEPTVVRNVSRTVGASRNPSLVASGGTIVLVWQEDASSRDSGSMGRFDVVFSRSIDGGATWEAPVTVAEEAGASPEPQVAMSGSTIGVAWLEDRPPDVAVRFARVVCR